MYAKLSKPSILFLIGRKIFKFIFTFFYRLNISGLENIPSKSGSIIVSNHLSFFDPPLIGSAINRPIYFMAKKELFDVPILNFLIKRTHAFPIERNKQDINGMKNAIFILKNGHLLLMFPEGSRSKNSKIGKAKAGAGMLACNTQLPLIPVKLKNTNLMLKFKRLEVKFGMPIYPPKKFTKHDYIVLSQKALDIIKIM
ncbi:MAG: 1-acyl-sn-glycerol-3-phosphate acyltransferase [Endomicrobium sp.]|jgi:1-acyl-sn-glycerol-3-phosphate acyltransferase|nr:1-acyl-sn-glycerol-3-phosphate acyltransferase [Endomicrobium sp.]